MDYSLLLGVHDADQGGNASGHEEESEETGGETDSVNSDLSAPDSPNARDQENNDPNGTTSLFSRPVEVVSIASVESNFNKAKPPFVTDAFSLIGGIILIYVCRLLQLHRRRQSTLWLSSTY